MKRTRPILLALSCACLALNSAYSGTVTWTANTAGNLSGSWNVAANPPWSTGAVPTAGDTADFSTQNITNTATVSLDGSQTVDALIFGDTSTTTAGIWYLVIGTPTDSTLTLSGSAPTITVNTMGTGRTTLDVPLAGTSGFTKNGVGLLTLTNLNTITGNFVVNAGTLGVQLGDAALGPVPVSFVPDNITLNGGTLYNIRGGNIVGNASLNTNRGITIGPNGGTFNVNNAPHVLTIGGDVTGTGNINKTSAGKVAFNGSLATWTGKFNVTGGQLANGVNGGTFGPNPPTFQADGLTLNGGGLNNASGFLVNWSIPSNRGITLGTSHGYFNIESSSGNIGISINSVISGAGQLRRTGLGSLTLNAANTYTGGTFITNGSPVTASTGAAINLGNPSALSSGAVTFVNSNSLTGFRYTGVTGGLVANNIALGLTPGLTNRWVIDPDKLVTFSGVISGSSASSTLHKDGTGTLALSGINTFSGTNLVTDGKLYGVTSGSCSNTVVSLSAALTTATLGVRVTDNTRQWACSVLECLYGPVLEFDFAAPGSTTLAPLAVTGAVVFNNTPTVTVNAANLPASTGNGYPLMTWGSASGTPPSTAELTLLPAGRVTGTLSVVGNTLYLQITSTDEPLRWSAGNAGWNNYGANLNWVSSAAVPSPTYFYEGDAVQFEDTQNLGGGLITLEGIVTPASVLVNSTNAYTFASDTDGTIAGSGAVTKGGSGTLTISNALGNSFSGGLTINAGTLIAATANGSAFGACGAGNVTVNGGATLVANGDNSLFGLTTGSGRTLAINSGGVLTNADSSSRLNRLVLDGGTVISASPNPTNGNWALDFGVATRGTTNTSFITGGNIALSQAGGSTFNVLNGDTLIVSSVLANTTQGLDNGLIKQGTGTLVLTGANTSKGATTLSSGTLRLGPSALPSGTLNLATATIASSDATPRVITNNVVFGTGASVTTFGDATGTGSLLFSGPASVASGTTGRTFINNTDVEMSGAFTGANGPFNKSGSGRLTLSGNVTVTWTGGWNINAGSLAVNGTLSATSAVSVANGALLAGNGTINAPSVIINPGGTIAPGTSIGTLTLSNRPVLSGATILMEINSTNAQTADKLVVVSGGVNFTGAALTVVNTGPAITNGTFALFSAGNTGTPAATNLPTLPSGFSWDLSALATAGTISVSSKATYPTNVSWSVTGNQLTLTWPASHTGWTLQAQTNNLSSGLGTNWVDISGTSSATNYTITVDPAAPTVFYRLRD